MNKNIDPGVPAATNAAQRAVVNPAGVRGLEYGARHPAQDPLLPGEDESSFNPLQILVYALRYRWLLLAFLVVGLAAGFLITMLMPPKYRAEAMIEIMPPTATIIKDLQVLDESSDIRTYQTALTKLKSLQMMRRVVHELGLADNREFLFPPRSFSFSQLISRALGRPVARDLNEMSAQQRENRAINILRENFSAQLLRRTRIILISYTNTNPRLASRIANQFANSYIATRLDQSSEASRMARQFIAEQVAEVKKKLERAEKELVDYAKKAGLTLSDNAETLIEANMKAINEALAQAIQERLKYERLVAQIKAGKAASLQQVLTSENIQGYREKIAELRAKYRRMSRVFKPDYPDMRELAAQIDELRRLMRQDVRAIADSIRLKYQVAIRKEQDLRKKLAELEARQAAYQDKNIRYTILKREVDSYRSQYQSLIDKMNRLGVAAEVRNKTASIVQYAPVPDTPFSPSLMKNLIVAFIFSIGTASAVIYILEMMNNTFSNPDQLEQDLKLPLLGVLPRVPPDKLAEELANARSSLAEAYRTLRTSLQFTGANGAPRSLLITSAEPGEGKSTIACKLAEEFGALGLNVLIIDADMRKPVQHRLAGIQNTLGLSNLLTNTVPVTQVEEEVEIMRNTPWANVWLVTAGTLPPNPANLLASQKMGMFIEACSRRFDIIIIDAPPVIGLADALLLSRLAEATMLVVAAQHATRKAVHNAVRKLQAASGMVVGTVFNRFKVDRVEYKYAYSYMNYGYLSYNYYGVDESASRKGGRKRLKLARRKKHDSDRHNRQGNASGAVSAGGDGAADGGGVEPADPPRPGAGQQDKPAEHGGQDSVA